MPGLLDLREAVVASLKTLITGVDIASHGGTFDLKELKRFATLAPAIRIAIVGAGAGSRFGDGRWKVPVRFAAVVVTKDSAAAGVKVPRDTAALLLSTAVELAVASNRFGIEGVFQPVNVEARSEYSGPVDELGIALWQVTWTSEILIGVAGEPGDPASSLPAAIAALVEASVNSVVTWRDGALTNADPGGSP